MSDAADSVLLWCENERACRRVTALLDALGRPVVVGRSVSEAAAALREHPSAGLVLVCFAGVPLAHAQAACRRFREEAGERRLRLLALVAPAQVADLQPTWGADDFLVLPGEAPELAARLRMILWRDQELNTDALLKIGPLLINTARHEVLLDHRPVALTVKEYELLLLLASSRDRVLTREAIVDAVWGEDYYGGERTVDVHIRRLRAKLPSLAPCIETVHGVGYRFTPERAGE